MDDFFYLKSLLKCVVVLGGGYIVVELVFIFNGLGSDVMLVYCCECLLCNMDVDLGIYFVDEMVKKGICLVFDVSIVVIEVLYVGEDSVK